MTTPTPAPVTYNDWERHWYRLLDFVQHVWARFAETRTCRLLLWLLPALIKVVVRLLIITAGVMIAVGGLILYSVLSMCLGGGAINKGVNKGNR